MKKLALATLAALTLSACAAMSGGNGQVAASAPAGAQYCWQDRLTTAGGKHMCNWAANWREACAATQYTSVEATRYSRPQRVRMCENGQWLVQVAPAS